MKQLAALAALLLSASPALADDTKRFTLADLRALVEQKAYQEAVAHLGDVAPAQRTTEWVDIAGTAAAGMVTTSAEDVDKLLFMIQTEKAFPAILKSKKYLIARADAAGAAFNRCFQFRGSFQECRDYALIFVDADPKNAKLTLDVAKAVRRGMSHFASVPFFKRALAANKQSVVCSDDDFEMSVVSGLGLDKSDTRRDEALTLANTCWSDIKDAVIKELTSETGHYRDNVCPLLVKWRAVPADKAKLCEKKG